MGSWKPVLALAPSRSLSNARTDRLPSLEIQQSVPPAAHRPLVHVEVGGLVCDLDYAHGNFFYAPSWSSILIFPRLNLLIALSDPSLIVDMLI